MHQNRRHSGNRPPKIIYTEADLKAIGDKLDEIGYMLLALHEVANSDMDGDTLETIAVQFAKRGVTMIDACHKKLGQSRMGNWEDEWFEGTAEEAGADAS